MKLRLAVSGLIFCLPACFVRAETPMQYIVEISESSDVWHSIGDSYLYSTGSDVRLITKLYNNPSFLSLSGINPPIQLIERFQYTPDIITITGKVTGEMQATSFPNSEATISITKEQNGDGASANSYTHSYQILFNGMHSGISELPESYSIVGGFPFTSTHPPFPSTTKVFTARPMLLYGDPGAITGAITNVFFENIPLKMIFKNGDEKVVEVPGYGRHYLVLSRHSQYFLSVWVSDSLQSGIPEGSVVAFKFQKVFDPAIRHVLVLKATETDELYYKNMESTKASSNNGASYRSHRRINSNFQLRKIRTAGHNRANSYDYHFQAQFQKATGAPDVITQIWEALGVDWSVHPGIVMLQMFSYLENIGFTVFMTKAIHTTTVGKKW